MTTFFFLQIFCELRNVAGICGTCLLLLETLDVNGARRRLFGLKIAKRRIKHRLIQRLHIRKADYEKAKEGHPVGLDKIEAMKRQVKGIR